MKSVASLAAATLVLVVSASFAQAQNARIRGTVEKLDSNVMTVKTAKGETATVKLAPNYTVTAVVKKTPADIKDGMYLGIGGKPQADGTIKAIQVAIFPEAQRGTGEGHRDWGILPETTMTNATVAATVASANGSTITLKYKDGEKKFTIGPDTNIISTVPAETSDLKVGVEMVTTATKDGDGNYATSRLTVGKNGVAPPL